LTVVSLSWQNRYRNSDLEAAIVKATSHDESYVDYRSAQRVFAWIRESPVSLKPLIWALASRRGGSYQGIDANAWCFLL
jgi:hypothetical protein